jgi:anthranilate/para-aminobenzoate synthase component I
MIYYPKAQYISVGVGSAITIEADPEQEYEECILKVNRLIVVNESE